MSHSRITRIAPALAVLALAAPGSAVARPIDFAGDPLSRPQAAPPVVTQTAADDFDWASAAIGACGASALLLLTAGAVRRRDHHSVAAS